MKYELNVRHNRMPIYLSIGLLILFFSSLAILVLAYDYKLNEVRNLVALGIPLLLITYLLRQIKKLKRQVHTYKIEDDAIAFHCINSSFNKTIKIGEIKSIFASKSSFIDLIDIEGQLHQIPYNHKFLETIIQLKETKKEEVQVKSKNKTPLQSDFYSEQKDSKNKTILLFALPPILAISIFFQIQSFNTTSALNNMLLASLLSIINIMLLINWLAIFKQMNSSISYMKFDKDVLSTFSFRRKELHKIKSKDIQICYIRTKGDAESIELVLKDRQILRMKNDSLFFNKLQAHLV